MNYFECNRVENCFSGTAVYQYRLNFKINDSFLGQFAGIGTVKCRCDLPRPYFNVTLTDGTQVKGVISDIALKVIFPPENAEQCKTSFEELLTRIIRQHQVGKE
jgi:hypothetical protein